MFILGTLKQWKKVAIGDGAEIRVLVQSMPDARRLEILSEIEHLLEDEEIPATDTEPARSEKRATAAWGKALHAAFGRECVKDWEGVGEQVENELVPMPCTPENIDLLMQDARVGSAVLNRIQEVNDRIVAEVESAGNG